MYKSVLSHIYIYIHRYIHIYIYKQILCCTPYLMDLPSHASQRAVWGVPKVAGTAVIAYLFSTYLAVINRSCTSQRQASVMLLQPRASCKTLSTAPIMLG